MIEIAVFRSGVVARSSRDRGCWARVGGGQLYVFLSLWSIILRKF